MQGAGPTRVTYKLFAVLLLLAGIVGQNAQAQSFPVLSGRVVDQAQLLDTAATAALLTQLETHEAETGNQIVVATIVSLDGFDIADYANRLGRHWQIGTAENDNGVLLVVAPNERKVRIEVGYGLEGALTDALASNIIQREILPSFRTSDYTSGINNGVDAVIKAIAGEYTPPTGSASRSRNAPSSPLDKFVPLIFIAIVAVPELLRRTGSRKAAHAAFPSGFSGLFASLAFGNVIIGIAVAAIVFLFMFTKGSGGGNTPSGRRGPYIGPGGGGFGGGGGFSGGGGSFGGGGASGSW